MESVDKSPTGSIDAVAGTVVRGRRWIALLAFLVPLATIGVVLRLPDQYTSSALLMLVQQQVPRQYVDPMNSGTSADLIRAVSREVLSAPRLSGIVDSFGLFASERGRLSSEQLAEKLRDKIEVTPVDQISARSDFTTFRLSFAHDDPKLAQQIVSQLTSLFIEVNLKERSNQAEATSTFLKSQLDAARDRLEKQEKLLLNARMRAPNPSPLQGQVNLGMIAELRSQLQANLMNAARIQQQRSSHESSLNGIASRLQSERTTLLSSFTPKHPEVVAKDREIEGVQALLSMLNSGKADAALSSVIAGAGNPSYVQMKGQIESSVADLDTLSREAQQLRQEIARYQATLALSASPVREQELDRAQRDYEVYKDDYTKLQNSYLRSQLTTNLEQQQSGQTFRLVDPPTLPAFPSGPKRLKISLGAIGAGLALGVVLAFLIDMRNDSFHREQEIKQHFVGPLIVGIPLMSTPAEERSKRRRRGLEFVVACTMITVVGAAEYYVYLHG